jgi:hypothetical protein
MKILDLNLTRIIINLKVLLSNNVKNKVEKTLKIKGYYQLKPEKTLNR